MEEWWNILLNLLQNLPHASEGLKLFALFHVAESSEQDQIHTLWGSMQHENVASFSNSFKLTIHLHALWAGGYLEGDCGYSQAPQGPVPSLSVLAWLTCCWIPTSCQASDQHAESHRAGKSGQNHKGHEDLLLEALATQLKVRERLLQNVPSLYHLGRNDRHQVPPG